MCFASIRRQRQQSTPVSTHSDINAAADGRTPPSAKTGRWKVQATADAADRGLAAASAHAGNTSSEPGYFSHQSECGVSMGISGGRETAGFRPSSSLGRAGNAFDHHPQKSQLIMPPSVPLSRQRAASRPEAASQRVHATFARESLIWALYIAKVINRREIHFLQTNSRWLNSPPEASFSVHRRFRPDQY